MKLQPLAAFITAACFCTAPVLANPVNQTVVSGTATISQPGNVLTVQTSNGTIINWNKFSIAPGEAIHFVQPSSSSIVLNRIMAPSPELILGRLTSNGRVFIVNPSGIAVGPGLRVNTVAPLAPRQFVQVSAPSLPPTLIATSLPPRGTLAVGAPARMVDGAVTLRMPLVDASAITIR